MIDVRFIGISAQGEAYESMDCIEGYPMALNAWLGSRDPEVHAEPEDAQILCSLSLRRIAILTL